MQKLSFIISLLFWLCTGFCLHAQPGGWVVRPSDFQFSMSVVAQIETNGTPNNALNNHVAAFSQEQIRAYAKRIPSGQKVYYFLTVYANSYLNDKISFLAFIGDENKVYESTDTLTFLHYKQYGSFSDPVILHFSLSPRPLIFSLSNLNYDEATCNPGFLMDVEASDDKDSEGNGLKYRIVGGADASRFKIDSITGALSWNNFAPDFEDPVDADSNNVYRVDIQVKDLDGNQSVQKFSVTVKDSPPPSATCPPARNARTSDNGTGDCSTTLNGILSVVFPSNCASYNIEYTLEGATTGQGLGQLPANQAYNSGKTIVRYTVTDETGARSSQCSFSIQVTDDEPLLASCPQDMSINTSPDSCSALAQGTDLFVSDNCTSTLINYTLSGATTGSGNGQVPNTLRFKSGHTQVQYTYRENTQATPLSCFFDLWVKDGQAPTLSCPGDKTISLTSGCDVVVAGTSATNLSDNCQGAVLRYALTGATEGSGNDQLPGGQRFKAGTTMVTYTATDADGTENATCSFSVQVKESIKPTITCPTGKNVTVAANCTAALPDYRANASVNDNCTPASALLLTQEPPAGTILSGLGPNTVRLSVTDLNNNGRFCEFIVTVVDNPILDISCPAPKKVCAEGQIGHFADSALVRHGCAMIPQITQMPDANTVLSAWDMPLTVTLTATEGTKTSSCVFTITRTDPAAPLARCKNIVKNLQNGTITITATDVDDHSSDNCGIAMLNIDATEFSCINIGPNTVTLTATDIRGLTHSCTAIVMVEDPAFFCCAPPSALCKAAVNIPLGNTGTASITVQDIDNGTTYDCGLQSLTVQPISVSCNNLNTPVMAMLKVTDIYGRSKTCQSVVTVKDLMPPTVSCPPATLTLNTEAGVNNCAVLIPNYVALLTPSDNCTAIVLEQQNIPAGLYSSTGNGQAIEIKYTATDGAIPPNVKTCIVNVNVVDDDPPTMSCPGNMALNTSPGQCGTVVNYTINATDNCSGLQLERLSGLANGATFPPGLTQVAWKATDQGNNSTNCSFSVTITDNERPDIQCPGDVIKGTDPGQCTALYNYTVTANDNCPDWTLVRTNGFPSGSVFPLGTHAISWKVSDVAGNSSTCNFTVTVMDTQPPLVNCPANAQKTTDPGQCSAIHNYVVSASDNCSAWSLARTAGLPSGSAFPSGVNTVIWKVTDTGGNSTICSFTVTIVDNQPPSISCPVDVVRGTAPNLCSAVATYGNPLISDNCAGATISLVEGLASGSTFTKGVHTIQWKVTDIAGLTKTCTFTVTVNDVQAPTITCPSNSIANTDPNLCTATVQYNSPVVSDNCTPVPTLLRTSGLASGSIFPRGINTIMFKATDGAGLTKTCTFRITVNDAQPPAITCPPNVVKSTDPNLCTALTTYANASATDNCTSVSVTRMTGLSSGSNFPKGINTVVWKATDLAGNFKTCAFTVTVNDTQLPVITCPANISTNTGTGQCNRVVYYTTPAYTDNCTNASVNLFSGLANGSVFPTGASTVVWRAVDNTGNSSTCSFTVTITDQELPVINCPPALTVSGSGAPCSFPTAQIQAATASDNCGVTSLFNNAPANLPAGTSLVTWTAKDAANNLKTCTHNVTVNCGTSAEARDEAGSMKEEGGSDVRASSLIPDDSVRARLHPSSLILSPNPASETVLITLLNHPDHSSGQAPDHSSGQASNQQLLLYDAQGRLRWQTVCSASTIRLDLADYTEGLYLLVYKSETHYTVKKLLIQR